MKSKRQTATITVRRDDDGEEFELQVISTFREIRESGVIREVEDKLTEVVSPDGRVVYTTDERHFFFEGEPDRPMRIVGSDEP